MLTKTERDTPISRIEINNRADIGIADVWLHDNIEETQRIDENGSTVTTYVADEVYFMHTYSDTLENDIQTSFDDWWNYGKSWTHDTKRATDTSDLLRSRIEMLEGCLLEMSELVYA